MFPFRTSSIFRSRWIALIWAAGIIWTAISLIPSPPAPADDQAAANAAGGDPMNAAEMIQLEQMVANLSN